MKRLLLSAAAAALLITSCFQPTPAKEANRPTRSVRVSIPIDTAGTFAKVAAEAFVTVLKSDDIAIERTELTISRDSVYGTVNNLPVGSNYTFLLDVFSAEGTLAYSGEAVASIYAGQVTPVSINVYPCKGSAIINGTIIEESDTVILVDSFDLTLGSRESVKDAYVVGPQVGGDPRFAALHYGNRGWSRVGVYDPSSIYRTLLQFPVDSIGARRIKKAELQMTTGFWVKKHTDLPVTVQLRKMLTPWEEGNAPQSNSESTWNGEENTAEMNGVTAVEAMYGEAWNKQLIGLDGSDACATLYASDTHHPSEGREVTFTFDVTALVNEWLSGEAANNGMVLTMADETRAANDLKTIPSFITWDNPEYVGKAPVLKIDFE